MSKIYPTSEEDLAKQILALEKEIEKQKATLDSANREYEAAKACCESVPLYKKYSEKEKLDYLETEHEAKKTEMKVHQLKQEVDQSDETSPQPDFSDKVRSILGKRL